MFWKEKETTIKKYQDVMKVVQETARKDLNDLVSKHILSKKKIGRNYIFRIKKWKKEC